MIEPFTATVGVVQGLNQLKTFADTISKYTGLVEDKLDKLAHSELNAAIRYLNDAIDSEAERVSLIRDARRSFTKAISLEKDRRLADAYLGLALCHVFLGDCRNARNALSELSCIEYNGGALYKIAHRVVGSTGRPAPWYLLLMPGLAVPGWLGTKIMRKVVVTPGNERAEELTKFQTASHELVAFALACVAETDRKVA